MKDFGRKISFTICAYTIDEVMGRNNLDYGMCEFYRSVIAYTRSQPVA